MKSRVFILGSGGRLGAALMKEWKNEECFQVSTAKHHPTSQHYSLPSSERVEQLDVHVIGLSRSELDFEHPEKCLEIIKKFSLTHDDFLINCAAMTNVDHCEEEPDLAMKVNATTPGLLSELAANAGARFLQVSTDYVFDGTLDRSYRENDQPNPISHYGATKLEGEQSVLKASPHHFVARVSWVFGPERASFVDQIVERARINDHVAAIDDKISSPAYTKDLADWFQTFFKPQTPGGIYHLCNSGSCSWREYGEYALQAAALLGMPLCTTSVAPLKLSEMKNFIAKRPQYSALDTTKFSKLYGKPLRSWQEAVEEYICSKGGKL